MRLFGFDSLDGLRQSLVARLGRERAGTTSTGGLLDDLSPMIEQLLLAEARRNEERIALYRAWLALLYVLLALVGRALAGAPSVETIALLAVWGGASLALYAALRRGWYSARLRRVVPVCDAVAIVFGSWFAARSASLTVPRLGVDPHAALAANVGVLCAFLVLTGALRLTVDSALVSALLAGVVLLVVAFGVVHLPWLSTLAILAGLWALSALARLMIDATQRVITTEVGRTTMERQVDRARARVAEAQAASTAREEVLRIVAHDLRNPLGTLLMAADMLGDPGVGDANRTKFVAAVKRSGASMNRLIQDLLNVARMERGTMAIDPSAVAPEQLIASAAEAMRPLAVQKSLTIVEEARAAGGAPLPTVNADAARIGQVFSNLIGNAIKFTPAGGTITLRADAVDGKVWFSVTDTGPGIPADQLERVFGEFWQARKSDSRGIGLGLTIAKGIVEAHGGKIGVSSEVGVGTRFWFGLAP